MHLPENNSQYVFMEEWFDKLFYLNKDELFNHQFWDEIIKIKHEVNKLLEEAIKNKIINHSLEASIVLYISPKLLDKLKILEQEIKFIFLTSDIQLKLYDTAPINIQDSKTTSDLKISLKKIEGIKCLRCWHYFISNKTDIKNSNICNRCIVNTIGNGETRKFI